MQPVTTGVAVTGYRLIRAFKFALAITSLSVLLIGSLALAHWAFGFELPKTPTSNFLPTTFCFALSYVSLALWWAFPKSVFKHRVSQLCGAVVAFAGLLTLSQYLIGWDLRIGSINKLLFRHEPNPVSAWRLERMLFNTALCFALSGYA